MIFLKSLLFIAWNIALGFAVLYSVKWYLFNLKPQYFLGKKVWFTPGLLVRKRDWLFNKARDILHDYLAQAGAEKTGYLAKWEKAIYDAVWEKTSFIEGWKLLPKALKDKLHLTISTAIRDLARNLLRKTVPKLIEQYRLEHQIDKYDFQFSIEFFYGYFRKYVYKPLIYVFLGINTIIGIMNMLLFLVLA
ncbi:MAG: hypothetical protein U1C33_01995 [Candidatus Cloacimonadaceae bacterium]|nr:hypothetical protein [Candidatus Cloacimonadaceae bacterium]